MLTLFLSFTFLFCVLPFFPCFLILSTSFLHPPFFYCCISCFFFHSRSFIPFIFFLLCVLFSFFLLLSYAWPFILSLSISFFILPSFVLYFYLFIRSFVLLWLQPHLQRSTSFSAPVSLSVCLTSSQGGCAPQASSYFYEQLFFPFSFKKEQPMIFTLWIHSTFVAFMASFDREGKDKQDDLHWSRKLTKGSTNKIKEKVEQDLQSCVAYATERRGKTTHLCEQIMEWKWWRARKRNRCNDWKEKDGHQDYKKEVRNFFG